MNQVIKLSERLRLIASFIPKGAYFADIGTDHAYLPCYICLNDEKARAIAGEVNSGPFERANEVVQSFNLSHVIQVKLGDGLDVIIDEPVNCITISGMGGTLITSILERGKRYLTEVEHLILQPNIDERSVRIWLLENGYYLTNEKIIFENGHFYEILVAQKNSKLNVYNEHNCDKQLLFGPILLKEKSEIFLQKWESIYNKTKRMITDMKKAKIRDEEKIEQFKRELAWMEEVLNENGLSKK